MYTFLSYQIFSLHIIHTNALFDHKPSIRIYSYVLQLHMVFKSASLNICTHACQPTFHIKNQRVENEITP